MNLRHPRLLYLLPEIGCGAPGGIRTPNPQIRSLMLCPVELRARINAEDRDVGRLLKIDYLQTLFKKETMERLRYFSIGNKHRAIRQQKTPSRDIQSILGVPCSGGKTMFPVRRRFAEFAEEPGDQLLMR